MNVATRVDCPSELALDRLVVGELAHDHAIQAHVESCSTCTARVAEREHCQSAFADEVPLSTLVAATDRKLRAARRRKLLTSAAVGAFAVICVALVWRLTDRDTSQNIGANIAAEDQGDGVRRKGGLAIKVMAKRLDGSVSYVVSPATLAPGDAIQFAVTTDRPGHLAVVAVDAASAITPYMPVGPNAPLQLPAGADQLLDGSIVLDDTPGFERIFAVLCDHPFDMTALLGRARSALATANGESSRAELADQAGCLQTSFLVEKSQGGR